jgi:type II restriction/modification system DNA methylase subunit YeeA
MTPEQFIAKWKGATLTERAASQSHFIDLCRLLEEPTPTDADPKGEWYAFERGASKASGGEGWADVWKRGHFGWEYKGKRRDLNAALAQLKLYALGLENPPLLIVCDMERFRVVTNWTSTVSETHEIALDELRDPAKRRLLKWALSDPEKLRPGLTRQALTERAAAGFADLATSLRASGHDPQAVAHFINRLVFCMFAEDVDLLPGKMFLRMLDHAAGSPGDFAADSAMLFAAMRTGGAVGFERVKWFNGGLFDDNATLPLSKAQIDAVRAVARLDWSEIDPSIFGTLFERGLDPEKRGQLGAHYTDRDKIVMIVEPVVMRPLLAEWEAVKAEIADRLARADETETAAKRTRGRSGAAKSAAATRRRKEAEALYRDFLGRVRAFRVLDPACGSGNFLYLGLQALKDIEHRAGLDAETLGLQRALPQVGPEAVKGIEINPYAAELARVTVWIGEIQWMRRNGYSASENPILRPLDTIERRDAILNADGREAAWPEADVIIGNPPFIGSQVMIGVLGEPKVATLRALFAGRLPGGVDFVTYWFEKARAAVLDGAAQRVGLVATQAIRQGGSRTVLDRITAELVIFDA